MAEIQWPDFWGDRYKSTLIRETRDRADRRQVAGASVVPALGGDREALGRVASADPDMAVRIAGTIQAMDTRKAAQARSMLELGGRLAAGVLSAPPDQQPAAYAAALEQARSLGLDTSQYPPTWGPAAKGWLQHNALMMGSVTSILKRIGGAGAGAGGGAPAGAFGGPRLPAPGAAPPVRTSDATPPGGAPSTVAGMPQPGPPPMQLASAALPPATPAMPPAAPQPRGPVTDDLTDFSWGGAIAGAPPASGAPQPGAAPSAPAGAPTDAPTAVTERRVPLGSPAMLGKDFVAPPDKKTADEFGLEPGEMYGLDPKKQTPIVENGWVLVRTRDRGDVWRRLPKPTERGVEPIGAPSSGAPPDGREAVRGLQLPAGYRVGGVNGQPVVKDGTVMVVAPDGSYDFVPLPQRADPALRMTMGYEPDPDNPGAMRPIRGGPADPAQARALAEAKRQENAKAIPASTVKGMTDNLAALKQVDRALALLDKTPDAIGGPGSVAAANLPGVGLLQNRIDKEGVDLRAIIANIGSLIIHQRSGAAVTASEFPRLRPFIPSISDDAPTARKKLEQFKAAYLDEMEAMNDTYNLEGGFRPHLPTVRYLESARKAAAGAPDGAPSVTVPLPAPAGTPKPDAKPTLKYNPQTGRLE